MFVQAGELQIIDDSGKVLIGDEAKQYTELKRTMVLNRLTEQTLDTFLLPGSIVNISDEENPILIQGKFILDDNHILHDYIGNRILDESLEEKNIFFNHNQIVKVYAQNDFENTNDEIASIKK